MGKLMGKFAYYFTPACKLGGKFGTYQLCS